jgi:Golgi nucleoside diphosphatase
VTFKIITAVNIKILVTWDVTPFSLASSLLQMKAAGSSERSVLIYQATECHTPEDHGLNENTKYYYDYLLRYDTV